MPYAFWDVSGVVPEWLWISGFMRKSSMRDNAPNMRCSVLLNSWDNFLVILPSFSSETRVMYSSCDLGTFEICAKLILGCSWKLSWFNAASFFFLLRVAIFYAKSNYQWLNKWLSFTEGRINLVFYSLWIILWMEVTILGITVSTTNW